MDIISVLKKQVKKKIRDESRNLLSYETHQEATKAIPAISVGFFKSV